MYSRPGKSSHDLLSDNQSNSISRDTVGPEDAFRGFPSNSSPSWSLPSADLVPPSVPDGDIHELPRLPFQFDFETFKTFRFDRRFCPLGCQWSPTFLIQINWWCQIQHLGCHSLSKLFLAVSSPPLVVRDWRCHVFLDHQKSLKGAWHSMRSEPLFKSLIDFSVWGELIYLKGFKKDSSCGEADYSDAIAAQVRRLAMGREG